MKIRWTPRAFHNLLDIHAYLAERDSTAAMTVARTIRAQAEALSSHPLMGYPGRVKGTRELAISRYPYVIAYRVAREKVEILAVRHMARRWPQRLD